MAVVLLRKQLTIYGLFLVPFNVSAFELCKGSLGSCLLLVECFVKRMILLMVFVTLVSLGSQQENINIKSLENFDFLLSMISILFYFGFFLPLHYTSSTFLCIVLCCPSV